MWGGTEDGQCAYYVAPTDPELPVLALDLDWTAVYPKLPPKGKRPKFPKASDDWCWCDLFAPSGNIEFPDLLVKYLAATPSNVVFFTNQGKITTPAGFKSFFDGKGVPVLKELHARLKAAGSQCTVSMVVAGNHPTKAPSVYRKPKVTMWELYCRLAKVDPERCRRDKKCTFVGDAAGRVNDFSDSDLKFAINIGALFYTPERFVALCNRPDFPPCEGCFSGPIGRYNDLAALEPDYKPFQFPNHQALVVLCGSPASGKSSWVRSHKIETVPSTQAQISRPAMGAHLYVAVSTDVLGTLPRCKKKATEALIAGRGVVVDNTNRTYAHREEWYRVARELGVPIVCVYFPRSRQLVEHLDGLRVDHPNPQERKDKRLPAMALGSFANKLEPPTEFEQGDADVAVYVERFRFDPEITPENHFNLWHS